jgi:uncharacterized membrane protein
MLGGRVRAGATGVLVVLMTLGLGAGVGAASGRPAPVPQSEVVASGVTGQVAAGPQAPTASGGLVVPAGFAARVGYRPVLEQLPDGPRLVRGDGGCSSPWGGTRYGFDAACRAHDLGYDLLRDAAATGRPYAGAARARVDARMWQDMAAVCHGDPVCLGVAGVYGGVVTLNSVSEAFSVPAPRSLHRVLVPVGGAVLVLAAWTVLARQRRWTCSVPAALVLGLAGAAASWQPSMLPRSPGAQLLVTALSTLSGVAVGALAGRAWTLLGRPAPRWRVGPLAGALLAATLLVGAAAGHAGQVQQAVPVGVQPISLWQSLLAGLVGAALAVVAAMLPAVLVRAAGHVRRPRPRGAAVTRQAWVVGVVVLLLVPGLAGRPDRAEAATAEVAVVGKQAEFLEVRRVADEIADVTGREALAPVRVAVPVTAGGTAERADRALDELADRGGLDRGVVLVALPTGSGWVNPAAVDALELLHAGDVATVTVQYDDRPSYQSSLSGGGTRAAEQADALLDGLEQALAGRAGERPRVVVYGESLGAVGGLQVQDHPAVDATVWAGVPQVARHLIEPGRGLVEHVDDPVTAWAPQLAVVPTERWRAGWVPLVSFWAGSADLLVSLAQPAGHGHRYGAELVDALDVAAPSGLVERQLEAVRVAVADLG